MGKDLKEASEVFLVSLIVTIPLIYVVCNIVEKIVKAIKK